MKNKAINRLIIKYKLRMEFLNKDIKRLENEIRHTPAVKTLQKPVLRKELNRKRIEREVLEDIMKDLRNSKDDGE